jgi:hypothetical protein
LELRLGTVRDTNLAAVDVFIDGTDLRALVAIVERPEAEAEGQARLAGAYAGLAPSSWNDLPEAYGDGRVAVLACECGEVGCWPLRVRIDKSADAVVWSDFQQPHRQGWDYSACGPFVFDRTAYDRAVTLAAAYPDSAPGV